MRARFVIGVNAGVILSLGIALLGPLVLSLLYRDGSWCSFLVPAAVMIPLGAAGLWASRLRSVGYGLERDVYLSVTLAWLLAALLGGIPYIIEGTFTSLLDSTFEGMSGFTTTGSTLLSDIEAPTPSILFWRSQTQWLGGIGIVVLFVAVAPTVGAGAARLLGAEVSGLTHTRLTPRIADTAKALAVIYLTLTVATTLALLLVGMNLYDAVVHFSVKYLTSKAPGALPSALAQPLTYAPADQRASQIEERLVDIDSPMVAYRAASNMGMPPGR